MKRAIFAAFVIIACVAGCAAAPEPEHIEPMPPCDDTPSAKKKDKDGGIGGTGRAPSDCR
jgi:hypothetical protein